MPQRLHAECMSLPELLRSRARFVLPATQRAYAWCDVQVDRLFEDAGYCLRNGTACIEQPAWLFLGTIYLADLADGVTAVADGQQRLVTGLMLYAGARDLEDDPERHATYASTVEHRDGGAGVSRLRLRDLDAAFFQRWVLDRGAMLRPYQHEADETDVDTTMVSPPLSESQANLLANRSLIVEKLRALAPAERRRLMAVFEQATEVVVVTAPTVGEALTAYASTLRRGLQQAEPDRLKFEIIGDAPPDKRRLLANHWEETEQRLGKEGLHELCGVLLQNRTGTAPPADISTGTIEHFDLPAKAEPFILDVLVPSAGAFAHLLTRGEHIQAWLSPGLTERRIARRIQGHIASLTRVTHDEWRGPAVAALLTFKSDLALLDDTLAALERLAAAFMITGQDTHLLHRRYGDMTATIVKRQRDAILRASIVDADLKSRARDLLASAKFAEKSRYRAPVLMKLNDLATGDVSHLAVTDISCEHVLPQNVVRSNTMWREAFRSANGKAFAGQHYRHRLGNLTLLTHAENRACADKAYPLKRRIFMSSSFSLSRDLAQRYETWTPQIVEGRTQDLVAKLVKHWDFG